MAKVLVIDDSSTMRKIVMKGVIATAKQFSLADPEFVEAGDGAEALEQLAKNPEVALILCDVNMPRMDGIQFVGCVRDQHKREQVNIGNMAVLKSVGNSIPIVMITTEGGLEKVNEALAAGANDYLKKPFTPEQFAEKVKGFLTA